MNYVPEEALKGVAVIGEVSLEENKRCVRCAANRYGS